jgi:HK97 family phage prohead protease
MSKELQKVQFDAQLDITKTYEEDDKLYVEGYAATVDYDDQGDIITPEAIKQSENDLLERSTVLFNHDKERPIGKVETALGDSKGLKIKVLISKAEPDIRQKIKEGIINKFSIRGAILESTKEKVKQAGKDIWANIIKAMKLIEVSMVSIPANSQAKTLAWYMSKALDRHVENISHEDMLKAIGIDPNNASYMRVYSKYIKGVKDRKLNDRVKVNVVGSIKSMEAYDDTDSCYIEIEEGEITEVEKSMADIKKKDGTLYTQEEIDAIEVKLQATSKEMEDFKASSIKEKSEAQAKISDMEKKITESESKVLEANAKLAETEKKIAESDVKLTGVQKELTDIKAKQADEEINKKVDAKWAELEGKSYKKEDATVIKSILKKGFTKESVTAEEQDSLISKKMQGSVLKLGFEEVSGSGEITKERKDELVRFAGIKVKKT